MNTIGRAFPCTAALPLSSSGPAILRRTFAALGVLAGVGLTALAQAAPVDDYNTNCGGCHGAPSGPRLNAADADGVITQANANHSMGVGGVSGLFGGIAGYIGGFAPGTVTAPAVGYRTAGNVITVTSLYIDRLNGTPPALTGTASGTLSPAPSSIGTGAFSGPAGAISNPTVTFTHAGTTCANVSFDVVGTTASNGNTTNRRVTVPISLPTVTASNTTVGAVAYSTSPTPINISGAILVSGVGSLPTGTLQLSGQSGVGTTNATGATTLTYTATGTTYSSSVTVNYVAQGPCSTNSGATRTITIPVTAPPAPTGGNLGPLIVPAGAGTATPIDASGVLGGFRTASPLAVVAQPAAGQGTVAVTGAGQFTYTASGYSGTTTFSYNVTGPAGGVSPTYTVTLTVTAAPVVSPASATTAFNTAIPIDLSGSIAGASTSVSVSGVPVGGTAVPTGATTITFTPTPGFFGTGSFQFTATGPGGTSPAPATVTVTVNPAPPTAAPTSATVAFNSGNPAVSTPINLAASITGPVTSVSAFGATNGTVSVAGTVVTFTPIVGYFGPAGFTYTATNAGGTSAPAAVSLTVSPPPAPTTGSLDLLVSSTTPTEIDLSQSITGQYATVSIVTPPTVGLVSLAGVIATYSPQSGFAGETSFTYRATGPGGNSVPGTVKLSYTAAPVTTSRSVVVPHNTRTTIDLTGAFAGVITRWFVSTPPTNGTLTVDGPYVFYTPRTGFFGADSFQFTAVGPGGTSAPGTVSITVSPPVAVVTGVDVNVPFETTTTIDLTTAITGAATGFTLAQPPAHGTVTISGTVATYTPAAGYSGADSFSVIAVNATGASLPGTIRITVGTLAPTAAAASLTVPVNGSGTVDLAPFIRGSSISGVSIAVLPAHGLTDVNGTKVTYTPRTNFFGNDTFTYVAYGNAGTSLPVVVAVTVVGRPDPSQDKTVTALVDAQAQTARRFTRAQIGNFQRRLESLHAGPAPGEPSKPGASPAPAATGPAPAPSARAPVPVSDPFARPQAASGFMPVSLTSAEPRPAAASASFLERAIAGTLVTAANAKSIDLGSTTGGAAPAPALGTGTSVWIGGLANFGKQGGAEEGTDLRFTTDGVSAGVDRRFSDQVVLGFGMGYGRDRTDIGTDGSRTKTTGASFAAYGSYQPTRSTFVDAVVGFGSLDIDTHRFVAGVDDFAAGTRKGNQTFGSLAAGFEWRRDGVLVSPYGRIDVSVDKLKESTETGAGLNALTFESQTLRSTQAAAGIRVESRHDTDYGWFVPRLRAEYRHEFQDGTAASLRYADQFGGTVYSVAPTGTNRNALLVGVGGDFLWRRGLKLGIDYQGERSSSPGTSQAIRFLLTQDLDGRFPDWPASWSWQPMANAVNVEAGYTFDDNVSRGRLASEKFSDSVYTLGLNTNRTFPIDTNTRAVATALFNVDKVHDNTGLGRTSGGLQGEVQYRSSGDFDAITYALFARGWVDGYESALRTGLRATAGANARRSITDRIDVFGEIATNWRRAESAVFEGRDYAAKLNVDYSLGSAGTAYVAGEYRRGDTFASGFASLWNLNVADVFVRDDAFDRGDVFAYRFEARTLLGTVGYNRPLGPSDSIDFSYRRVQTTPLKHPETGPTSYSVNQYSILYLMRF